MRRMGTDSCMAGLTYPPRTMRFCKKFGLAPPPSWTQQLTNTVPYDSPSLHHADLLTASPAQPPAERIAAARSVSTRALSAARPARAGEVSQGALKAGTQTDPDPDQQYAP